MKIIQQVLLVLFFMLICPDAFAMSNNKPRPPSGVFGKKSSQKNMILVDVVKGRPQKLEGSVEQKQIAKQDNSEIVRQTQANIPGIKKLSNTPSRKQYTK